MCHKLRYLLLSFWVLNFCLASSLQAQMIGAGANLEATTLDTAGGRINVTTEYPTGTVASEVFDKGRYKVSEFAFKANPGGGGGFMRPFLAKAISRSPVTYETVWVGPPVAVTLDGVDTANFESGAEIFTLSESTEVFGGVYHDGVAKLYTNLSVGVCDHDNAGPIEPTDVEQAVGDFSHVDLPRTYAFGITVISAVPLGSAAKPSPARETTDAPRDSVLSWAPGEFAASTRGHIVYFGENFDDVNDASGAAAQDAASYTPPERVDFGTTYYWRVDEVNSPPDSTVYKGEVWSFTVEPFSIPVAGITVTASSSFGASGPENTINGSGLADDLHGVGAADMWISGAIPATIEFAFDRAYKLHEAWIWNSNQLIETFVGFGAKDVVVEYTVDGENWTVLEGVGPLAQATGLPGYAHNSTIDFGGAVAQQVRLTVNSVQGIAPQASLSEVRFYAIPTIASRPTPESGATDVSPDTSLSWGRNGREAGSHEVFIGTDPASLVSAGATNDSSLDTQALDLQLGQTYHWRVDENNDVMDPSTWEGTVWNFTTADAISIDNMETYKDEEFFEIWATWVDGFDDPANGSLVGGATGTPETGIVHGGSNSLPMDYGTGGAAVSEATRTFDAPMDWTGHGVQGLVLYFQGSPSNTGGQLYVKINDIKVSHDGGSADLMSVGWNKWYVSLSAVAGADLSRVTSLTIGVDSGGAGVVYIDSIFLTGAARELVTPADPGTAGLLAHYPLDGDYQDASGNGLHGSAVGAPTFENDPSRGQVMRLNGFDSAVDLGADEVFNFPGSFSLSVWANITDFTSNWGHALLGKRGENGVGWQLRRHAGNPNLTFTARGTDGADDPRGNIDITTAFGQWVHVAAVYDMESGQRTVYVNSAVDVSIDDGGVVAKATQNTYMGARSNSGNTGPEAFFSGALDEVRVYGRALSLEEVASLAGRTQPFDKP